MPASLLDLYSGWDQHNALIEKMVAPLDADQLGLRPAANMWSIRILANHIVAVRAGWFGWFMGEGGPQLMRYNDFDEEQGSETRTADEIVVGLRETCASLSASLKGWTEDDMAKQFQRPTPNRFGERPWRTRQWVVWHVAEHDVHHAGEISLILGMHRLTGIDL